MTPQPENWLARAKKLEPARLVRNIKAILAVASLLGYVGLTQAQITFLGTQLEIILPLVGAVLWPVVEWVATRWLRSKVTPQAKVEPIAEVLVKAEEAQARGEAVVIPPSVAATAKQVIGVDPSKVVNPL